MEYKRKFNGKVFTLHDDFRKYSEAIAAKKRLSPKYHVRIVDTTVGYKIYCRDK